jgi:hypothetical protein
MFMHTQANAPGPVSLRIVDGTGREIIRQRSFAHIVVGIGEVGQARPLRPQEIETDGMNCDSILTGGRPGFRRQLSVCSRRPGRFALSGNPFLPKPTRFDRQPAENGDANEQRHGAINRQSNRNDPLLPRIIQYLYDCCAKHGLHDRGDLRTSERRVRKGKLTIADDDIVTQQVVPLKGVGTFIQLMPARMHSNRPPKVPEPPKSSLPRRTEATDRP